MPHAINVAKHKRDIRIMHRTERLRRRAIRHSVKAIRVIRDTVSRPHMGAEATRGDEKLVSSEQTGSAVEKTVFRAERRKHGTKLRLNIFGGHAVEIFSRNGVDGGIR